MKNSLAALSFCMLACGIACFTAAVVDRENTDNTAGLAAAALGFTASAVIPLKLAQ